MPKSIASIGEFALIDLLHKCLPVSQRVIKGIGDDTAVLPYAKGRYLLFTTDMMAENVHFLKSMKPQAIGHKALACNISDIAAMGGLPTFAVVSLGLPKNLPVRFVEDIYKGMQALAKKFNVSIVGGDTIKSDKIIINVALLGEVEEKHLVTRHEARVGDWVFVTGPLGGSFKSGKHLNFMPRLEQAQFLVKNFKPNAMMDVSDGLAGDLNHILRQSKVGVCLDEELIPRLKGVSVKQALTDGEDFELLFTMSADKAQQLMAWQNKRRAFYFYPIGIISGDERQTLKTKAFTHF